MKHYYHIFANGDDVKDFIISIDDFKAAFNRFGVCAAIQPDVRILAFSIEDSHPHCLIFSTYEECVEFKSNYEKQTRRYITASRGGLDRVRFELEIAEITDEDYLLNVAAYVIVQPTKDGKQIMHYDYYWGTGSMYFRPQGYPFIWCFDSNWMPARCEKFGSLQVREKNRITHSKVMVPDSWLVCNELILPSNYLARNMYEAIFKTCNRFRVYTSSGRKQLETVTEGMAMARGITMPDLDARKLAQSVSLTLFGKHDQRFLSPEERLGLAKELRTNHHLSMRQTATLSRLPENEIRKYFR